MPHAKIILASQSPRRIELLRQIVSDFEVIPSAIEEVIDPQRTPRENAVVLAVEKALWVASNNKGHFVLGADTLVVLDGEIIGKPIDRDDAYRILRRLSGREHQVITGVAIVNAAIFKDAASSTVAIKPLTDEEIFRYIDGGEPMDIVKDIMAPIVADNLRMSAEGEARKLRKALEALVNRIVNMDPNCEVHDLRYPEGGPLDEARRVLEETR